MNPHFRLLSIMPLMYFINSYPNLDQGNNVLSISPPSELDSIKIVEPSDDSSKVDRIGRDPSLLADPKTLHRALQQKIQPLNVSRLLEQLGSGKKKGPGYPSASNILRAFERAYQFRSFATEEETVKALLVTFLQEALLYHRRPKYHLVGDIPRRIGRTNVSLQHLIVFVHEQNLCVPLLEAKLWAIWDTEDPEKEIPLEVKRMIKDGIKAVRQEQWLWAGLSLKKAFLWDPLNYATLYTLGDLYAKEGQTEKAIEIFKLIPTLPRVNVTQKAKAWIYLAQLYIILQQLDEAKNCLGRVWPLPNLGTDQQAVSLHTYAKILVKENKVNDAIDVLKQIPLIPRVRSIQKAYAWGYLSELYATFRQWDWAETSLERALNLPNLKPDDRALLLNTLGSIQINLGKIEQAVITLSEAETLGVSKKTRAITKHLLDKARSQAITELEWAI